MARAEACATIVRSLNMCFRPMIQCFMWLVNHDNTVDLALKKRSEVTRDWEGQSSSIGLLRFKHRLPSEGLFEGVLHD